MIDNKLLNALYNAMRADIGVMSEYGDDETALYNELATAPDDIINEYKTTFLGGAEND